MSLVKSNGLQVGQSVTATNNFTMYQPSSPDGTVRWGVGNSGSVTDVVTLNSSGNVGIGTSSPNKSSSSRAVTLNNSSGFVAYEIAVGDAEKWRISSNGSFVYEIVAGTQPRIWYNNGAETMRLDSSGNLGLGVTPSTTSVTTMQLPASFVIGSKGTGGSNYTYNAYYNGGWKYAATASSGMGAAVYFQNSTGHAWQVAGTGSADAAISFTQAMTLDASGNLGIGTSSPVSNGGYGGLTLNGTNGSIFSLSTAGTEGARLYNGGNETSLQCKPSTGYITFVQGLSGGTERMRIDSSGNVGIGTATIGYKLTVDGYVGIRSGNGVTFLNAANNYTSAIANGAGSGDGDITFSVGGTTTAKMLSSHNFQFNSNYGSVATAYGVRSWVKFQGTGTVTINYSGNVSSITDAGTGIYYINFASGMTDVNYCPQLSAWDDGVSATSTINKRIQVGTASQVQVFISDAAGTGKDANPVFVSVVR